MVGIIKIIVSIVNYIHDYLNHIFRLWLPGLNDKDLHFLIIGIIGLILFILTDYIFKRLAKYNITIISVIYTFTVLVVIVFSIEIEQKITKRGSMEFSDIVSGLWGAIIIVAAYIILKAIYNFIVSQIKKHN